MPRLPPGMVVQQPSGINDAPATEFTNERARIDNVKRVIRDSHVKKVTIAGDPVVSIVTEGRGKMVIVPGISNPRWERSSKRRSQRANAHQQCKKISRRGRGNA